MSIDNDVDLSDRMAVEMAQLHAELGDSDEDVSESAAPEADGVEGDPGEDDESKEEDKEEPAEPLEAEGGDEARAEVAKLFADGDLKAACAKLGLDPGIFKVNNRQFAAARQAESSAKRAAAEATARDTAAAAALAQSEALRTGAEKVYGPIVAGNKAYRVDRDMAKAKAAVELLFEDSWENIQAAIAKGVQPLSPAELRVIELERRLEAEKTEKTTKDTADAAAAQQTADVAKVTTALAKTPLADVEGAAAAIVKVIRASYNPALKKNTKTLKEAYAEVKAGYVKQVAQLAKLSGRAPKVEDEPEPAPRGKRGAPARKPLASAQRTPPAKVSAEDAMDAEMQAARKEFEAEQRRAARGKR